MDKVSENTVIKWLKQQLGKNVSFLEYNGKKKHASTCPLIFNFVIKKIRIWKLTRKIFLSTDTTFTAIEDQGRERCAIGA
jgi:hypothetical protein